MNDTRVIYHPGVRTCAKMRCDAEAAATVGLSYAGKVVVIGDLAPEPDPNLLDLCSPHVARLTPPIGWSVRDERASVPAVRL